ncbi:MAG: hypothetical protein HYT06_01140, partial [Candidatus Levybacteria bacterium]|nr:hypothetical protein [Candidatus Levybacteria bacterium]
MKKIFPLFLFIVIFGMGIYLYKKETVRQVTNNIINSQNNDEGGLELESHPLSIETMRSGDYPGSDIVIEQTLSPGSNYNRSIVSYKSEGLKIYALLTVPLGDPAAGGWPVIVFNHGFIPPAEYQTA